MVLIVMKRRRVKSVNMWLVMSRQMKCRGRGRCSTLRCEKLPLKLCDGDQHLLSLSFCRCHGCRGGNTLVNKENTDSAVLQAASA